MRHSHAARPLWTLPLSNLNVDVQVDTPIPSSWGTVRSSRRCAEHRGSRGKIRELLLKEPTRSLLDQLPRF